MYDVLFHLAALVAMMMMMVWRREGDVLWVGNASLYYIITKKCHINYIGHMCAQHVILLEFWTVPFHTYVIFFVF